MNANAELSLLGLAAAVAGGVAWANDYFVFSIILMALGGIALGTSLQQRDKRASGAYLFFLSHGRVATGPTMARMPGGGQSDRYNINSTELSPRAGRTGTIPLLEHLFRGELERVQAMRRKRSSSGAQVQHALSAAPGYSHSRS